MQPRLNRLTICEYNPRYVRTAVESPACAARPGARSAGLSRSERAVRGDGRADPPREPTRSVARCPNAIITKSWAWPATRRPRPSRRPIAGLARKYHPDVNPGDKTAEAKFKEVQQAYDILSDPEKRSRYDRFGDAGVRGDGRRRAAGRRVGCTFRFGEPGFENVDFSQFFGTWVARRSAVDADEDGAGGGGIFEDLLAGCGPAGRGRPRAGRAMEAHLTIPFLTAVRGGETTIEVQRGDGQTESLVVKIPPGIETGAKLRLKGRGEPGAKGAPAGDLTILITVEPHPYFNREGETCRSRSRSPSPRRSSAPRSTSPRSTA